MSDGAGVAFEDVQAWLTLFAQAIADRPLLVEPVEDEDAPLGRDRGVLDDPTAVRVPMRATTRGGHRVAVLRQLGPRRYGTLEVDASELSPLGRRAFLALEDQRIDAVLARDFPGARADLADAVAADRPDTVARLVAPLAHAVRHPGATAADSLALARAFGDGRAGDPDVEITPISAEELAELLGESLPDDAPGATYAMDLQDGEAAPPDQLLDGGTFEILGELRVELEVDQATDGGGTASPDTAADAAQRDDGEGDGDGADEADGDAERPRPQARRVPRRTKGLRPPEGHVYSYDEWSYLDNAYLRAWCHVIEERLKGDDLAFIGDVRRRHAALASKVKRRFAFTRSEGWRRVHRTADGDELEIDAVIEALIDKRAGQPQHDRLYVRRDRAAREVATAFLVDLSASTSSPIDPPVISFDPEPEDIDVRYGAYDVPEGPITPPRRVIDIAKESLALMCDALGVLGDRHAVYGFSGEGRECVDFPIAKDFDDPVSMRTWAALAAMAPRRYTRMGPAIRHAAHKLRGEQVRTRVLIVLSDGYPQDVDYGPDRTDREYGVQDTARALREAEAHGIVTFCVTIDPAGHDYLRRMCPESRYLVIPDVTALPDELVKVYRTLTSFAPGRA